MLHEEAKKYRELSGDTNPNTPISRIGGYLDGYEKALEQKPCEDTINREDALMCLTGEIKETDTIETIIARFGRRIRKLPPVTPQPKTGHWIRWYEQIDYDWDVDYIPHCKCSECGKEYDPHSSQFIKYCNECGAKMIEPQEREEA